MATEKTLTCCSRQTTRPCADHHADRGGLATQQRPIELTHRRTPHDEGLSEGRSATQALGDFGKTHRRRQ